MGLPERLLRADDLLALGDEDSRRELVVGHLLCEPPASFRHGEVAARIFERLRAFAQTRDLGLVVSTDTGFVLAREPDTVRAPDVAFVSRQRIEQAGLPVGFFPGPPDFAVEILSPTDRFGDVRAKVADYLAAGTRLVWVVDPAGKSVSVYRSLLSPRVLSRDGTLEGEDVVPGFSMRVAELFD